MEAHVVTQFCEHITDIVGGLIAKSRRSSPISRARATLGEAAFREVIRVSMHRHIHNALVTDTTATLATFVAHGRKGVEMVVLDIVTAIVRDIIVAATPRPALTTGGVS